MSSSPRKHPDQPDSVHQAAPSSVVARIIAVIDLVLGMAVAAMVIDSPLYSILASLMVFLVTAVTAWGLFSTRKWGWWLAMTFHCVIPGCGSIAYIVIMCYLVQDFGRPPNHMAMVTPEGIAIVLTFIFLIGVVLATVPVLALRTRRCRQAFGVSAGGASDEQEKCQHFFSESESPRP